MKCPIRHDIAPPPEMMSKCPIDLRGYPVPHFVAWQDGQPEFRAFDGAKFVACVQRGLCSVCGNPLGKDGPRVFVIGPMCAINRTTAEPPCHPACARYSATNCPFLSKPQMVRRTAGLPDEIKDPAGIGIKRNPGVTLLWWSNGYEISRQSNGYLFHFTREPKMVEWYREGRRATRPEVEQSIETGLPILREVAANDGPGALKYLEECRQRALKLLPKRAAA